jgi:hypothetical protein
VGGSLKASMERGTDWAAWEYEGFGPLDGDEFNICSRELFDFPIESEKAQPFRRTK